MGVLCNKCGSYDAWEVTVSFLEFKIEYLTCQCGCIVEVKDGQLSHEQYKGMMEDMEDNEED
jgi:hypothetical protein